MIGQLQGVLLHKQPPSLLLDVQGVGYELDAPMSTFYALPAVGQGVTLHTHLAVREDAQQLYGFATLEEKQLFRDLIRVSGIGGKLALAILSGISVKDFIATVQRGDAQLLTQLPGIGKKTAERLVLELRDRIGKTFGSLPELPAVAGADRGAMADAYGALLALGYKEAEAARMLKAAGKPGLNSEELIRLALQNALK
ncbi:MAG TPA: Holliday junction branch migration protein RuvA [Nevskiales bacterium]|nr:Holliday junction branch migration protein RuvA [Nevskiales bacterium]